MEINLSSFRGVYGVKVTFLVSNKEGVVGENDEKDDLKVCRWFQSEIYTFND